MLLFITCFFMICTGYKRYCEIQLVLCISLQKFFVVYRILRRLFTTHTLPYLPLHNTINYNMVLDSIILSEITVC